MVALGHVMSDMACVRENYPKAVKYRTFETAGHSAQKFETSDGQSSAAKAPRDVRNVHSLSSEPSGTFVHLRLRLKLSLDPYAVSKNEKRPPQALLMSHALASMVLMRKRLAMMDGRTWSQLPPPSMISERMIEAQNSPVEATNGQRQELWNFWLHSLNVSEPLRKYAMEAAWSRIHIHGE